MISSVFGKTKPINYIIVLVFLFAFYWFVHFFLFARRYTPEELLLHSVIVGILLFGIFMVNFIVSRNKVTEANAYAILFYALLIVVFPETITDSNAILCSFFILLAIRRIISIKSLKYIKFKIFDATFWIMVSSLFYDWALLFLIMVFAAIYLYEPKNIRNWIVPIIGFFTFLLIMMAILVLIDKPGFLNEHYAFSFKFNVGHFFDWGNSTKLASYILVTSVVGILAFVKIRRLGLGRISTLRLIAVYYGVGMAINFLKTGDNAFPIIVTFFPAVIFMNNYIETIGKPKLKEAALFACILIPFVVLISSIIIK